MTKPPQGGKATAVQHSQKTPAAVHSLSEASPAHGGGGASRPVSTVLVEGAVSDLLNTPTHSKVHMGGEHGVEPEGAGR